MHTVVGESAVGGLVKWFKEANSKRGKKKGLERREEG
jgi:hypothetical protein